MAANTDPDDATTPDKTALRSRIRAERRVRRRRERETGSDHRLEADAIARAALEHLDRCPEARAAGWGSETATVAVFRSTPSEPDTTALVDALRERGVRVLVPRTRADLRLDWHELLPPPSADPAQVDVTQGVAARDMADGSAPDGPASDAAGDELHLARPDTDDSSAELPSDADAGDEGPSLGLDAVADITAMILPGLAVDGLGHRLGQGGGCYDRTLPRMRPDTCRAVLLFDEEVVDAVPFGEHDRLVPAVLTPGRGWVSLSPATSPPT